MTLVDVIEPPFWEDKLSEVPVCQNLINNWEKIRQEVLNFVEMPNTLFDYPKYDVYADDGITSYSLYKNLWKAVPVSEFKGEFITTQGNDQTSFYVRQVVAYAKRSCPSIHESIKDLEADGKLVNGFISKLVPGSKINPHRGRTPDFMRIHLGLVCDPDCKLTVGSETRVWKEGEIIAFKDGGPYPHSVEHFGRSQRIILSVDVDLNYLAEFVPGINRF
jgi:aspartyl/asparaginyl beta-hydroxylase (cupin superfamily)